MHLVDDVVDPAMLGVDGSVVEIVKFAGYPVVTVRLHENE